MLKEWLQNMEDQLSDDSSFDTSEVENSISSMLSSIDEETERFMDALDAIYAE